MKLIQAFPYVNPNIPFDQLTPDKIVFYMHLSNKTGHSDNVNELLNGQKTCGSACVGCYFKNLPPYEIPIIDAQTIASDLRKKGYDVGIVTADSFSNTSLYDVAQAGSAFRLEKVSCCNANAWTSGFLISQEGWEK